MEEEWRIIEDFPDYQVSNLGRVRSMKWGKEKLLKLIKDKEGYTFVVLSNFGCLKTLKVHRIVATAFIPNPLNFCSVDHINRIKEDNCAQNLRWISRSQNNLNRSTASPTPYIRKTRSNSFQFRIEGKNYHSKTFKSLEEAVAYRDSILNQTPSTPEV